MSRGISLFLILILLIMLPIFFIDVMFIALMKLAINPLIAPFIILSIFLGSLINIPIHREISSAPMPRIPFGILGLDQYWPRIVKPRHEKIIAMNVGGFIIPILLVAYECSLLVRYHSDLLVELCFCIVCNVVLCNIAARPVEGVGIVIPTFVPGVFAALSALAIVPEMAPPIAFCAGVLGPIIGADFMYLGQLRKTQVGMLSIGGAGTFDGIVISGLIAVILA